MGPPNKLPQRKPSILGMRSKYRSADRTPSDSIHSTPTFSRSSNTRPERRHVNLRNFFSKSREPEAQSPVLTPPSSSSATLPSPPIIPKFTKAFVNALNSAQLCDFLTWMLYYEVVELPEDPKAWYKWIGSMEMRGWISLGGFLAKSQEAGPAHEFDLIVLESICDRIGLSRPTVHTLLIRFADPEKMKYGSFVPEEGMSQDDDAAVLKVLENTQSKLYDLYRLAIHLKPQQGSQYEEWLVIVQKCLRAFLHLVIGPRITHLRTGKPLTTAATSEHLPKDVIEGIKMNYLYEAMHQERTVPSERYGIYPIRQDDVYPTPQSSLPPAVGDEAEQARNHAIELMVENRELRSQITVLQQDKERLMKANEKLAQKITRLGRLQPIGYVRSFSNDDRSVDAPDNHQHVTLQVPQHCGRRRSVSTGDIEALAKALDQGLNIDTHQRQHSDTLAQKYEDVFSSLQSSPLPTLRLSALPSSTNTPPSSITDLSAARPTTLGYASRSGRRSGMVFDRKSMKHLAGAREGMPTVEESDNDEIEGQAGGYVPLTPTPEGKKRFDLLM